MNSNEQKRERRTANKSSNTQNNMIFRLTWSPKLFALTIAIQTVESVFWKNMRNYWMMRPTLEKRWLVCVCCSPKKLYTFLLS